MEDQTLFLMFVVAAILGFILSVFIASRGIKLFATWKKNRKIVYLASSIFLCMLSFYIFSALFVTAL